MAKVILSKLTLTVTDHIEYLEKASNGYTRKYYDADHLGKLLDNESKYFEMLSKARVIYSENLGAYVVHSFVDRDHDLFIFNEEDCVYYTDTEYEDEYLYHELPLDLISITED